MLFFFRSIFAQTLLNVYFVFRIWKSKVIPKILKYLLLGLYGIETIVYFIGLSVGEGLSTETYTLIQEISGIWVIGHVYLLSLLSFFDLIYYLDKRFLLFRHLKEKNVRIIKIISFVAGILFISIQLYTGYDNFLHPVVKTYPFAFNKTANDSVSPPKATYKLLVASDLHLGYIVNKKMLKTYVNLINEQHADIVVINGDLVDYTLLPLLDEMMDEELRQIKAPKGIYFIPGNHEYKNLPDLNLEWIRLTGMTVLKDSAVHIDNQLILIGRDDKSNDDRMPVEDLMLKIDSMQPCIFLSHQPADIKDACKYDIPLTICGHTHGGQAFPFNIAGRLLFPCVYGMKQKGNTSFYVTSGLGLSGFPLRIATCSEVVVFNIEIY